MPILASNHEEERTREPNRAAGWREYAPYAGAGFAAPRTRSKNGLLCRFLLILVGVAIAYFIRALLAHGNATFAPFLTFYPMVLVAALLDGAWAGILVTLISAAVAEIFEMAPRGQWLIKDVSELLSVVIFAAFGIALSIVIEVFRRNREQLAHYELRTAIDAERRKTEAERKVVELVAAERKRLMDVLETLPSMVSLVDKDHRVIFANSSFRQRFGRCEGVQCFAT